MDAILLDRCELLITNRNAIKKAFFWQGGMMHLCAALVYTMHGLHADPVRLHSSYDLIRTRVGMFNNFRSTSQLALAAMLDVSGDPETILDRALTVYDKLKEQFMTSSYLPLSALTIAQHVPVSHYDEVTGATRAIYKRMRKEHPFLTSSEDCAFCTLFAMSGMDEDKLLQDMETCYQLLKSEFFSSNAVQGLSHALTLYPGDPTIKAQHVLSFYHDMKARGQKWGTGFELPLLGVVAMTHEDRAMVMEQVLETEAWLKQQKGFGFWSNISRTQRLMYAGILVNAVIAADGNTNMTSMTINSAISTIIAQQAAASAAVSASAASH